MKRSRIQTFLLLAIFFFILVFPSYFHCSYIAEANLFSTDLGFEDSGHDIKAVTRAFASAWRSQAASFDAVRIHAAHGLLSQFFPCEPGLVNRRNQEAGGRQLASPIMVVSNG